MNATPRQKFTWVELVVIIGVCGCCLALYWPALGSGAHGSRRTQCVNNLKQIGLAIQNYHDIRHEICPAYLTDDNSPTGLPRDFAAWPVLLLPYIEQINVYELFDVTQPVSNATARTISINTYFCPTRREPPQLTADGQGSLGDYGSVSLANALPGVVDLNVPRSWDAAMLVSRCFNPTSQPATIDGIELGPGDYRSMTRFSDVTDGLSNTAFIGEKAVRADRLGGHKQNFARTIEPDQQDGTFYFGGLGVTNNLANLRAPGAIAYWSRRLAPEPKSVVVLARNAKRDDPANRFGSWHPGITLFLKGDGSVSSVSLSASNRVLVRFGGRNEGQEPPWDLP